jgi:GNAT superfamily N-acetyltransferase
MIISRATTEDAAKIAENNILLAKESEGEQLDQKTVLAGVQTVLEDEGKGFYLVAKERNVIIGQLMITYEWSDWRNQSIWWVQSVYVSKNHRKSSVFTTLLKEVKKQAIQHKVSLLRLYVHESNTQAITVYQHTQWKKPSYQLFEKEIKDI